MMASPSNEVEAAKLPEDVLPTEIQVFQHYLYLKTDSGKCPKNAKMNTMAKLILPDIVNVWNKTGIPFTLEGRNGESRVQRLISQVSNLLHKKAFEKGKFDKLFDVAMCQCSSGDCSCKPEAQVPDAWRSFLHSQRTDRKMTLQLRLLPWSHGFLV